MTARRRVLLGMLSTVLALMAFRRPAMAALGAATSVRPLGQRLAAALPHGESAARIGRAVIRSRRLPGGHASVPARQWLQDRLTAACAATGGLDDVDDHTLRSAIRAIIAQDFAAERTVAVDGWRFAESEAAIYRTVAEDSTAIF